MPSIAEELAELKNRSLTKAHAAKLQDAKGLSTPEQEENFIKAELEKTSLKNYTKEATATLNAGVNAVDQDLQFKVKQIAAKKEELLKHREAAKNLQSYNEAKVQASALAGGQQVAAAVAPAAPDAAPTQSTSDAVRSNPPTQPPADAPVTVETAGDDDDDDVPVLEEVEEVPTLEEVPDLDGGAVNAMSNVGFSNVDDEPSAARVNRAERKSRRIMEKLGLKKVPGVTQVTLKMSNRQGMWTIYKPDVFEKNGSYVIFGEARQGGGGRGPREMMPPPPTMQAQQAQAVQKLVEAAAGGGGGTAAADGTNSQELSTEIEDDVVDESGVDAKDIELVISQAGCSRSKAVKALKENDGDLVNAIMSLTA